MPRGFVGASLLDRRLEQLQHLVFEYSYLPGFRAVVIVAPTKLRDTQLSRNRGRELAIRFPSVEAARDAGQLRLVINIGTPWRMFRSAHASLLSSSQDQSCPGSLCVTSYTIGIIRRDYSHMLTIDRISCATLHRYSFVGFNAIGTLLPACHLQRVYTT